jgi:DNA repair protein RecO (recombination protein O)
MRIALQPAFVLHHRPYRETSVLLDLFTQDHGRIALVARGVKQLRSPLRPLIQLFVPLLVSWQGKGDLMTLVGAESNGSINRLLGGCLLSGLYLNELITHLLPRHDPHPTLYTIYHQTLLELQGATLQQKYLRLFEKKLLEELGYGLQLTHEISENAVLSAEKYYRFYPEQGFRLDNKYKESDQHDSNLFLGKNLLALAAEKLEDETSLRDAKRLMRLALSPLLGQHKLHSRELFIQNKRSNNDNNT